MEYKGLEGASVERFECYTATKGEHFCDACFGDPDYEYKNVHYCIIHFPSDNKEDHFKKAVQSKLQRNDLAFAGAYFPSEFGDFADATLSKRVDFGGALFRKAVSFRNAIFHEGATFNHAYFREPAFFDETTFKKGATFYGTNFEKDVSFTKSVFDKSVEFRHTTFSTRATFLLARFNDKALFSFATFSRESSFYVNTVFSEATFGGEADFERAFFGQDALFSETTFKDMVNFREAAFCKEANFSEATFKESVAFHNLETFPATEFRFRDATIDKPERVSFRTVNLRPSWFVDVDVQNVQKFAFSEVEWFRLPNGAPLDLEDEVEAIQARQPRDFPFPSGQEKSLRKKSLRKLAKACSGLMHNAEENRDYPTVNEMHYWSMEAVRKEGWRSLGLTGTLYWMLSGYGERPRRSVTWIVTVWLVFSGLYWLADFSSLGESFIYSLSAVVGKGPRLDSAQVGVAYLLVALQIGIIGILTKLLVTAIRRKFMK